MYSRAQTYTGPERGSTGDRWVQFQHSTGDRWDHLFKCQISMPLKNRFAKKETKNSKLHPWEQEVPAFWFSELNCCYCRGPSLTCMCFCWGVCMYRVHNISRRQRNMRRQFDLGGIPDHSYCCWECCVTKLLCSAALGLLLSQELWLMDTSQKASAGQTCFSQSTGRERKGTI